MCVICGCNGPRAYHKFKKIPNCRRNDDTGWYRVAKMQKMLHLYWSLSAYEAHD